MKSQLQCATALLLLTVGLISCGAETVSSPDNIVPATAAAAAAETETEEPEDFLPADLDLGGKTVNLFIADYANSFSGDMYSDGETGNRLTDAVYHAIKQAEERLNATLSYTIEPYVYADMGKMKAKITGVILADDPSIDLYFDVDNYSMQMLENPYFIDLSKTAYINIDSPWYDSAIVDVLPGDYIYCLTGNFALANIKYSYVTYFNTELLNTLDIEEDLYQTVENGKWTVDHLQELIKDTYQDLNGDSAFGPEDRYGLTFGDENKFLGFPAACGVDIFTKKNGQYEFTYGTERSAKVMETLWKLVNECPDVEAPKIIKDPASYTDSGNNNKASVQFLEGRALFTMGLIADAPAIIPKVSFQCGLLPMPKFADQEEYRSPTQRHCYAFIPTSSAAQDEASAVLEALSGIFYRSVNPEFVEVTLKNRYSANDNVSRMYDLIMQTHSFETFDVFESLLSEPGLLMRDTLLAKSFSWSSAVQKSEKKWENQMEKAAQINY